MRREWGQAVSRGSVDDLRRLLDAGADIDSRDGHGQTALMRAAARGQREVAGWLVEQGASLDHTAKYGLSALMLAVINGHTDVVRILVSAGANVDLAGTGAPGFAGRTALDLATDRGDRDMVDALGGVSSQPVGSRSEHFAQVPSWEAAGHLLAFLPRRPSHTAGQALQSLHVHVRDHSLRDLPIEARTLEAHYGRFVLTQSRPGADEARRLALEVRYGPEPEGALIHGREARLYALGPETPPDDLEGRQPAVVAWCDGDLFYFTASIEMSHEELFRISSSVYAPSRDP